MRALLHDEGNDAIGAERGEQEGNSGKATEEREDEPLLLQTGGPQFFQRADVEDRDDGIDFLDRRPDGRKRGGRVAIAPAFARLWRGEPHDEVHRAEEELVHRPVESWTGHRAEILTTHIADHTDHRQAIAADPKAVDLAADRISIAK